MNDLPDPVEIDFAITPKPWTPPPAWRCVVCEQMRQPGRWSNEDVGKPPVCRSCARHWSNVTRLPLRFVSRADHLTLSRLSAILKRLEWEIINGRRRWA